MNFYTQFLISAPRPLARQDPYVEDYISVALLRDLFDIADASRRTPEDIQLARRLIDNFDGAGHTLQSILDVEEMWMPSGNTPYRLVSGLVPAVRKSVPEAEQHVETPETPPVPKKEPELDTLAAQCKEHAFLAEYPSILDNYGAKFETYADALAHDRAAYLIQLIDFSVTPQALTHLKGYMHLEPPVNPNTGNNELGREIQHLQYTLDALTSRLLLVEHVSEFGDRLSQVRGSDVTILVARDRAAGVIGARGTWRVLSKTLREAVAVRVLGRGGLGKGRRDECARLLVGAARVRICARYVTLLAGERVGGEWDGVVAALEAAAQDFLAVRRRSDPPPPEQGPATGFLAALGR